MRHAHQMANQMRLQASLAAGKLARPRLGLISSYDPKNYAAKVRIQPEDVETGWMPICTMLAGNGFGVYFGPTNGDQCVVNFQEGDGEVGFITGFLNSDTARPPSVPVGHLVLADAAGSSVALTNDGKILSAGSWQHTGDIHATGTVTGVTDVVGGAGAISLKGHKHTGVQAGAAETGGPTNT